MRRKTDPVKTFYLTLRPPQTCFGFFGGRVAKQINEKIKAKYGDKKEFCSDLDFGDIRSYLFPRVGDYTVTRANIFYFIALNDILREKRLQLRVAKHSELEKIAESLPFFNKKFYENLKCWGEYPDGELFYTYGFETLSALVLMTQKPKTKLGKNLYQELRIWYKERGFELKTPLVLPIKSLTLRDNSKDILIGIAPYEKMELFYPVDPIYHPFYYAPQLKKVKMREQRGFNITDELGLPVIEKKGKNSIRKNSFTCKLDSRSEDLCVLSYNLQYGINSDPRFFSQKIFNLKRSVYFPESYNIILVG